MFKTTFLEINPKWQDSLDSAGLLDIEAITQRDFDWFEAPNKRRGGWSGVTRIVLNPKASESEQRVIFLKIQQNHFYIAPNTCFLKRLTFEREYKAISELGGHCRAVPEVLLFAKWENDGERGAILITEALDDWHLLRDWQEGLADLPKPDKSTLHKALKAIANTSRQIHKAGWVHMCYSSKHLFVKEEEKGNFKVKTIDLEKSRKRIGMGRRTVKDCSHFMRHTPNLDDQDKIHYLRSYFQTERFTARQIKLIRKMRGAPRI